MPLQSRYAAQASRTAGVRFKSGLDWCLTVNSERAPPILVLTILKHQSQVKGLSTKSSTPTRPTRPCMISMCPDDFGHEGLICGPREAGLASKGWRFVVRHVLPFGYFDCALVASVSVLPLLPLLCSMNYGFPLMWLPNVPLLGVCRNKFCLHGFSMLLKKNSAFIKSTVSKVFSYLQDTSFWRTPCSHNPLCSSIPSLFLCQISFSGGVFASQNETPQGIECSSLKVSMNKSVTWVSSFVHIFLQRTAFLYPVWMVIYFLLSDPHPVSASHLHHIYIYMFTFSPSRYSAKSLSVDGGLYGRNLHCCQKPYGLMGHWTNKPYWLLESKSLCSNIYTVIASDMSLLKVFDPAWVTLRTFKVPLKTLFSQSIPRSFMGLKSMGKLC